MKAVKAPFREERGGDGRAWTADFQ